MLCSVTGGRFNPSGLLDHYLFPRRGQGSRWMTRGSVLLPTASYSSAAHTVRVHPERIVTAQRRTGPSGNWIAELSWMACSSCVTAGVLDVFVGGGAPCQVNNSTTGRRPTLAMCSARAPFAVISAMGAGAAATATGRVPHTLDQRRSVSTAPARSSGGTLLLPLRCINRSEGCEP